MAESTRIFIHGLDSSNKGTKAVFFRERYPDMIIPTFKGSLLERMKSLDNILSDKSGIRLVGSSFGGLMAALFAAGHQSVVEKMILLAPAINFMEFADRQNEIISVPVWIYHGIADDVIPLAEVETIAKKIFSNLSFNALDDDHLLHKTFQALDWGSLLS